eukprot:2305821-Pleurochrysis_carterae.AAC.1
MSRCGMARRLVGYSRSRRSRQQVADYEWCKGGPRGGGAISNRGRASRRRAVRASDMTWFCIACLQHRRRQALFELNSIEAP